MVFNSLHFVAFFLIVYSLYRVLPHRAQNWLLLAGSYYFYAPRRWWTTCVRGRLPPAAAWEDGAAG
jgi:hypothetical protein